MLPKVLVPTKSYGLPSSVAPSLLRVTGEAWPVRRSPRTTVSV